MSTSRFNPSILRTLVRSVPGLALLLVIAAAPANGSPVTPTYVLEFGGEGFGPGQTNFVNGMAVDSLGTVYVANGGTNKVQKFDALGNYLGEFGEYGTGDGQFWSLYGIVGDGAGNFYVTEHTGNRIQKVTSTGVHLAKWGSGGTGAGQFSGPRGIARDAAGNLYVADSGNNRIQKFTAAGAYVTQWGTFGAGNGQFNGPADVVVDRSGFVYVSDIGNHRIQKFTSAGAYVAQWGTYGPGVDELNNPNGLALDVFGFLYVTDAANDRVHKYTADGVRITTWGSWGAGPGQFWTTGALAVDAEANVYVFDANNHRVQKFSGAGAPAALWPPTHLLDFATTWAVVAIAPTPGGEVLVVEGWSVKRYTTLGASIGTLCGGEGSGNGQFLNPPTGIATDTAGNVYVLDGGNARVQKFSSTGTFLTKWGSAGAGDGQFNNPYAVDVDAAGNVYVVDADNHRIQKFTSTGVFLAKWGALGSGNGQFTFPAGIGIDRNGLVYIADTGNHRIQKFTGDGLYLDQWGSFGSGPGQFDYPEAIVIEAAGNVCVADGYGATLRLQRFSTAGTLLSSRVYPTTSSWAAHTLAVDAAGNLYMAAGDVKKFVFSPEITYATDVPGDEGRRVRLRFRAATSEAANSGAPVLGYDVYVRTEPATAPGAAGSDGGATIASYLVPATGAAEYVVDVDAAVDATAATVRHSGFMVRAWSGQHSYCDSELHYGLSIDNLPPPAPSPFVVDYGAGAARLHWTVSPAADFTTFRLYRSTNPAFVPGPGSLLVASPDTGYVDAVQPGFTYKLSAVDDAGNESPFAVLGPSGTVDVPAPVVAFGIDPLRPNPATSRSALNVRFTLPRPAAARLELVDVAGRRMVVREVGGLGVGSHAVDLAAERPSLGSGVYFVRLVQDGDVAVRRVVLLD